MDISTITARQLEKQEKEAWIDDNIIELTKITPENLSDKQLKNFQNTQFKLWKNKFKKSKNTQTKRIKGLF